ncbi:hypothetical protein RHGRI_005589 [Rhododendron griersonianum]|uniref:Uncharacterized protein n=1 Tax=Rhododendron griersonianum TaxID=479676 RepID=A0AAV6LCT4_9ERIC|nr:hypothetical protein RHGRI_005589 [Rhododendron griersonianum]
MGIIRRCQHPFQKPVQDSIRLIKRSRGLSSGLFEGASLERVAYGEKYEEKQRTCLAARTKILKMDFRGPSIMIYAGFGDLLLKGAANLIWAWKKKFKEGAKELSRTLVGLDNKENMEAVRAMRIEMATMHTVVKAINREVDLLLAGPTRPVRPTLPLAPPPPYPLKRMEKPSAK